MSVREACCPNPCSDTCRWDPAGGPVLENFSCDQLHFIREDRDGGPSLLGFCCFKFFQRFEFQKLLSDQKYLLTIRGWQADWTVSGRNDSPAGPGSPRLCYLPRAQGWGTGRATSRA